MIPKFLLYDKWLKRYWKKIKTLHTFLTYTIIRIFVQKIRKNKWWNLEKIPKDRFFGHIFGIFSRKKMFFENRAPSHFRYCHFTSVCKFSWKNINKVQLEKFKKCRFSGKNPLLRQFLQNIGNCYQLHFMYIIRIFVQKIRKN